MAGSTIKKGVLSAVFFGVAACSGAAQAECNNDTEITGYKSLYYQVVDGKLEFSAAGYEARVGKDGGIEVTERAFNDRCQKVELTAAEQAAKQRADMSRGLSASKLLGGFIADACDPNKSVRAINKGTVEPTGAQMDAVCKAAVKSVTFKMNK